MTISAKQLTKSSWLALWIGIAVLLFIWASRVIDIGIFPPFIDESIHIYFTEITLEKHPFIYAEKYYLFSIWWWAIFAIPHNADPLWLIRVVTLLTTLPGIAALMWIGRQYSGWWGALIGGLLYAISAYHTFFDRLALADPISASAVLLAVYFAYRLKTRVKTSDAILVGVAVWLALGAKLSALPYLGIPVAAFVAFNPRAYRWLFTALATEGILTALFVLALIISGRNPFSNAFNHVGISNDSNITSFLSRIPNSLEYLITNLHAFAHTGGLIVIGITLAVLVIKRQWFWLLALVPPALVFTTSAIQSSRYYAAPVSLLLVCVMIGILIITRHRPRITRTIALLLIALSSVSTWIPFISEMNSADFNIALPERDHNEYIKSDATGFGLREVYAVLQAHNAQHVIGIAANCQGLRYLSWQDISVECPAINPNGSSIPTLSAYMQTQYDDQAVDGLFVVLEDITYLPDTAPGKHIDTIQHSTTRPALHIYDLTSEAQ